MFFVKINNIFSKKILINNILFKMNSKRRCRPHIGSFSFHFLEPILCSCRALSKPRVAFLVASRESGSKVKGPIRMGHLSKDILKAAGR